MKQDIFKNFKKEVRKYPINAVKVLEKMGFKIDSFGFWERELKRLNKKK